MLVQELSRKMCVIKSNGEYIKDVLMNLNNPGKICPREDVKDGQLAFFDCEVSVSDGGHLET